MQLPGFLLVITSNSRVSLFNVPAWGDPVRIKMELVPQKLERGGIGAV